MKTVLLYSELRALLAPVIPHACTDDMLPVLCTIPIATSGDYLVAQATDRFTAAFKRVKPAAKPPARFGVQLQAADAKRMVNLFRPSRGVDPEITIEPTGTGEIKVTSRSAGFALGFTGLDLEFLAYHVGGAEQPYPDMASLLPKADDVAQTRVTRGTFSIPFMTRFKAAIDAEYSPSEARNTGVQIQLNSAPNKPLIVTVGDDFIGLIMPKLPSHSQVPAVEVLKSWHGIVPVHGVKPPGSKPAATKRRRAARGVPAVTGASS